MADLPVGTSVRFKPGSKDYDFDTDIAGWQGRIVEIDQEHGTVTVAFDSITLRAMPGEYIEICEDEGLGWTEYGADPDELEIVSPQDTLEDVEAAIAELSGRYAYSHLGKEGREMNTILAGIDPDDEQAVMERWSNHLSQVLIFPFAAEVVERLFERGPIQIGDRLQVLGIDPAVDRYGILADVRRGRDSYVYPLCDLETVDEDSPNHDPLQLYRVWFANR